jgi:hypothetical protein
MGTRSKGLSLIAAGVFAAVLLGAASPAYAWGYGAHVGYGGFHAYRPHVGFHAYAGPYVSFSVGVPYYGYPYPYYAYAGYPYPYYNYPYAYYGYARPYYGYSRHYYRYPYSRYPYSTRSPRRVAPRPAPYGRRY